jgi:hypothetical protein
MGATVAIFSVVNALVILPLPYPESAGLVQVWSTLDTAGLDEAWVSWPRFELYTSQATAFTGLVHSGSTPGRALFIVGTARAYTPFPMRLLWKAVPVGGRLLVRSLKFSPLMRFLMRVLSPSLDDARNALSEVEGRCWTA